MLEHALDSVRVQSLPPEIIVIDNGSSDGTAEYMATVDDPRVRYVVNPENLGVIGSINRGVGLFSEGVVWLTVLPDDDLLAPDFVERMAAAAMNAGVSTVAQGRRVLIDAEGKPTRDAVFPAAVDSAPAYLEARSRGACESYLTGVFFSRAAFAGIGGYPSFTTGLATDDAFIFALTGTGRLHTEPDAVAYVRMHPEAESHHMKGAMNHLRAVEDFRNFIADRLERLPLGESERHAARTHLERYCRRLASCFCIRGFIVSGRGEESVEESMSRFIEESSLPLSLRPRMDCWCWRWGKFNPESLAPYRLFWGAVEKFARMLSRRSNTSGR